MRPARLRTRALLRKKNTALNTADASWEKTVKLDKEETDEVQWWLDFLKEWNGHHVIVKKPTRNALKKLIPQIAKAATGS